MNCTFAVSVRRSRGPGTTDAEVVEAFDVGVQPVRQLTGRRRRLPPALLTCDSSGLGYGNSARFRVVVCVAGGLVCVADRGK